MEQFLTIFFQVVVVVFTIASTLFAGYSIQNKLRLRNIRMSWRAGKLGGFPLFATLFFGSIGILAVIGYFNSQFSRFDVLAAYFWISGMWFISSYLASKYYLTDYGIVKNINEPSQTIPWFQVLDYVEKEEEKGVCFTFTYSEMNKNLVNGYNQVKLFVPAARVNAVRKILSLKLHSRFKEQSLPEIDLKRIQDEL